MIEIELHGRVYRNIRGTWYDSSYIKPSEVIIAELESLNTTTPGREATPPTTATTPRAPSATNWGRDFRGLAEDDFQHGVTGTHWRSRASLGGALAAALRAKTGRPFTPWPIYRRADVYIALPSRFREENKFPCAKFALELSPDYAVSGFYCEKSDEEMSSIWDWLRLLDALNDSSLQHELGEAMATHKLQWLLYPDYAPTPLISVSAGNPLLWKTDDGAQESIGWAEFVKRLRDWPQDQWLNLYLGKRRAKTEAINAGIALADAIVGEYAALVGLYDVCSADA